LTELANALRLLSTLACGVVLVAFVLFAADQRDESNRFAPSQAAVAGPEPAPEAEHTGVRGAIEDANDALVAPFEGVAPSRDVWAAAAVPALLALLTYGLLARLLIGYLPARR
jgi:hypothetical protein